MTNESYHALVDGMIDACADVIESAMVNVECATLQHAAISALGMSIASSTLRSIRDEAAAKKIAADLIMTFASECSLVLAEVWSEREMPQ